jgi:hypothetical protein
MTGAGEARSETPIGHAPLSVCAASERQFADTLLAWCTTAMYDENPYRVCRLDADAPPDELRRAVERCGLAAKLGAIVEARDAFGGLKNANGDAANGALARLVDPIARIVCEYFWFWRDPAAGPTTPDPAIGALAEGDPDRAALLWENRLSVFGRSRAVALHNIAVLHHARALDAELAQLGDSRDATYVRKWRKVLSQWRLAAEDAEYWRLVSDRIERIADPRVPATATALLRRLLPTALAQPHAHLLRNAAESGDRERVRAHRMIMAETGCGDAGIAKCIDRAVGGLIEQLRLTVERSQHTTGAITHDAVLRYLDHIGPALTTATMALADRRPSFRTIRDDAVQLALNRAIEYANESRDWLGARALLEAIGQLPASSAMAERIGDNMAIARDNITIVTASPDAVTRDASPHGVAGAE